MTVSLPMATEILPAEVGEAEGCVQCQRGSKLVLFVTGKCHWGCDYCPLSENRRESPDMFANERRCNSWEEVIEEGHAMKATGTGITGGDPMLDLEKSLEAVKQLKSAFGPEHHIHLYTSIPFDHNRAADFGNAGLDEIRFHLLDGTVDKYLKVMQACKDAGIFVGVELPCEPDKEEQLFSLMMRNLILIIRIHQEKQLMRHNQSMMMKETLIQIIRGFYLQNPLLKLWIITLT